MTNKETKIRFKAWDTIDEEWKYGGYPDMPLSQFFDMVDNDIYINVQLSTTKKMKDKILGYMVSDKGKIIPIHGFSTYKDGKPLLDN